MRYRDNTGHRQPKAVAITAVRTRGDELIWLVTGLLMSIALIA